MNLLSVLPKTLSLLALLLILTGIAAWVINGGIPVPGPTGSTLPIHLHEVNPRDGESVSLYDPTNGKAIRGYCGEFFLREGNGMYDRNNPIHYYFDGVDVSGQTDGIITLNFPPSYLSKCFISKSPLSPGWHTAKITYQDNRNKSFQYTWRFQVVK